MKFHHLKTTDSFSKLALGDAVYLSGTILTARDMAHKRISELIAKRKKPPFALTGTVLFHAGPIVRKANRTYSLVAIGSTTSGRMNPFNKIVSDAGVKAIIGKGGMNSDLRVPYLAFTGGCAALGAKMLKITGVYWPELGDAEAVWKLEANEFGPLIVAMKDKKSLYK